MKGRIKKQFVNLNKKEIPKTEDRDNEFKEVYQCDEKLLPPKAEILSKLNEQNL